MSTSVVLAQLKLSSILLTFFSLSRLVLPVGLYFPSCISKSCLPPFILLSLSVSLISLLLLPALSSAWYWVTNRACEFAVLQEVGQRETPWVTASTARTARSPCVDANTSRWRTTLTASPATTGCMPTRARSAKKSSVTMTGWAPPAQFHFYTILFFTLSLWLLQKIAMGGFSHVYWPATHYLQSIFIILIICHKMTNSLQS